MKKTYSFMMLLIIACLFLVNVTAFAGTPVDNLVYNTEEVNGLVVSETIYKMENGALKNFMKHNYKYNTNNERIEDEAQKWNNEKSEWVNDLCIRYTISNKTITTEYYKWNTKKHEYVLIPSMTVTMDK